MPTYRANDREIRLLPHIIEKPACSTDSGPLRQSIADDLLKLMQARLLLARKPGQAKVTRVTKDECSLTPVAGSIFCGRAAAC